jgi:hypothetical protein
MSLMPKSALGQQKLVQRAAKRPWARSTAFVPACRHPACEATEKMTEASVPEPRLRGFAAQRS